MESGGIEIPPYDELSLWDIPSEPLKKALIQFVSAKANEFGLTADQIKTHRQIADSSCPGSNYQGWFDTAGLPEIEKRIAE